MDSKINATLSKLMTLLHRLRELPSNDLPATVAVTTSVTMSETTAKKSTKKSRSKPSSATTPTRAAEKSIDPPQSEAKSTPPVPSNKTENAIPYRVGDVLLMKDRNLSVFYLTKVCQVLEDNMVVTFFTYSSDNNERVFASQLPQRKISIVLRAVDCKWTIDNCGGLDSEYVTPEIRTWIPVIVELMERKTNELSPLHKYRLPFLEEFCSIALPGDCAKRTSVELMRLACRVYNQLPLKERRFTARAVQEDIVLDRVSAS